MVKTKLAMNHHKNLSIESTRSTNVPQLATTYKPKKSIKSRWWCIGQLKSLSAQIAVEGRTRMGVTRGSASVDKQGKCKHEGLIGSNGPHLVRFDKH